MKDVYCLKCDRRYRLGVRSYTSVALEVLTGTVLSMKQKPAGHSRRKPLNQNMKDSEKKLRHGH